MPGTHCFRRVSLAFFLLETINLRALYVATQAILSQRFVMHVGLRDGLLRQCVARSSLVRGYTSPHPSIVIFRLRARHVHGVSCCSVSVRFETHDGSCEGLCDGLSHTVSALEDYAIPHTILNWSD